MKPDELGASIGFALVLIVLHQRGILARAIATLAPASSAADLAEQPELAAGNAELSRAYELTREAIERARAA